MTALREPALLQQAFVIALMVCAFGVLLSAFARPATALVVSGGLFLGLNFLSVMKLRYLDSPLMPADFVYYARSSLLETLGHYPHLWMLSVVVGVVTPVVLWAVWHFDRRLVAHLSRRRAWSVRLSGMAIGGSRSGCACYRTARSPKCMQRTCGRSSPTTRRSPTSSST